MRNVASYSDSERMDFKFACECKECGAEGDLSLDVKDGMRPFNCPEGCGAVYVPWKNPLNHNRWELKSVVMPVFDSQEDDINSGDYDYMNRD